MIPIQAYKNARFSRIFFQDFPGPGILKKKIPDLFRTFQKAWEPCRMNSRLEANPW